MRTHFAALEQSHQSLPPDVPPAAEPGAERTAIGEAGRLAVFVDIDGSIEKVYAPSEGLLGYSSNKLVRTSLFRHIHEWDLLPVFRGIADVVEGREQEVTLGFRMRTAGGFWQGVQASIRACCEDRTVVGLLLTLQLLSGFG